MINLADAATAWGAVAEAWDAKAAGTEDELAAATAALVDGLHVAPGDRVLELGAGPGELGATWSELVGPRGRVVVSDIAPAMVEVAARRLTGLGNVGVKVLDATAIDEADSSFHAVACRMGLMFSPDPAAALLDIRRVLRDGGRFGALTWAGIEYNPWMTCLGMAVMANGLVAGGPPTAPGGVFSLDDPSELETLARDAGFRDAVVRHHEVTFTAPTVDDHLDRVGALAGPLASVLRGATPEERAAVRRTASELAAPYVTDDGVALPGRALLLLARC